MLHKIVNLIFLGLFQENFLMFCPSHSSLKFPSEKSQFGEKSTKNNSKSTQMYISYSFNCCCVK